MTLEEKLARLAECGFKLAFPFTVQDLLKAWSRADYEQPGWYAVLSGLAMTEQQEPWRPHCINLCLLDMECIEGHGDYKTVAKELVRICQGLLPLGGIEDYVDVEEGKAWLSFRYGGQRMRIDCRVENDWLDPTILRAFGDLIETTHPSRTLAVYYPDQSVMAGCITRAQLDTLRSLGTGFDRA